MEAYYSGIPAISTDCDFGPADIIKEGEDGFLIPVDNLNSLREKLELLVTDSQLRTKFSTKARLGGARFEMKNIAEQWEKLIKNALSM